MTAFDACGVEEASIVADQPAAREHQLGLALQSAGGDRTRTVGKPLATLQVGFDHRVGLVALELLERRQVRVLVIQPDDVTDRDQIVLEVVDEAAAVGGVVHRPAGRVYHQAGLVVLGRHLPQFLQADAVGLGVGVAAQIELRLQLLAEVAATALGEQGVLGMQFHAGFVVGPLFAFAGQPHVAGRHTLDRAVLVVEDFGAGKAGIDLDTQRLGLFAEPLDDVAEADDIIAVVEETAGQQAVGDRATTGLRQEQHLVFRHRRVEGSPLRLPVRDQLGQRARVHHRARQDMGAEFGGLLDQADRVIVSFFGCQLLQADRRRQPGRAAADDQHVEFHGLAFHLPSLVFSRFDLAALVVAIILARASTYGCVWYISSGTLGESLNRYFFRGVRQ